MERKEVGEQLPKDSQHSEPILQKDSSDNSAASEIVDSNENLLNRLWEQLRMNFEDKIKIPDPKERDLVFHWWELAECAHLFTRLDRANEQILECREDKATAVENEAKDIEKTAKTFQSTLKISDQEECPSVSASEAPEIKAQTMYQLDDQRAEQLRKHLVGLLANHGCISSECSISVFEWILHHASTCCDCECHYNHCIQAQSQNRKLRENKNDSLYHETDAKMSESSNQGIIDYLGRGCPLITKSPDLKCVRERRHMAFFAWRTVLDMNLISINRELIRKADRVQNKRNNYYYYCVNPLSYRYANFKRQYSTSNAVHNHLRYKCGNKSQFACSQCEYRTKQKRNLYTHIQLKHTAKECTGCGLEFNDNVTLRIHMSTECKTQTMLQCHYCLFTCNLVTKMKEHVQIEHKSRYQCRQCAKKYKNYKSLKCHENVCRSKSELKCDFCDYKTTYKVEIQAHLQARHPELA